MLGIVHLLVVKEDPEDLPVQTLVKEDSYDDDHLAQMTVVSRNERSVAPSLTIRSLRTYGLLIACFPRLFYPTYPVFKIKPSSCTPLISSIILHRVLP
jgi:hypothetical protein